MNQLSTFFSKNGFPDAEAEKVALLFKKKNFQKGDFFAQEGRINHHLGFIEKGLFQYFSLKNGEEITTYITGENTFITSLSSFIGQIPSKENIRSLMEGEVWQIHYSDLQKLKAENEFFKPFYIEVLEHLITCVDDSKNKLITHTADERYELILKEEPNLLQQIPLQYLASILGITPRHLSRIRKNIK